MLKWTILLATAGFIGAAIFYSPALGWNAPTPLTCPLCPNIDSAYVPPIIKPLGILSLAAHLTRRCSLHSAGLFGE
jgi:hypothetical protein